MLYIKPNIYNTWESQCNGPILQPVFPGILKRTHFKVFLNHLLQIHSDSYIPHKQTNIPPILEHWTRYSLIYYTWSSLHCNIWNRGGQKRKKSARISVWFPLLSNPQNQKSNKLLFRHWVNAVRKNQYLNEVLHIKEASCSSWKTAEYTHFWAWFCAHVTWEHVYIHVLHIIEISTDKYRRHEQWFADFLVITSKSTWKFVWFLISLHSKSRSNSGIIPFATLQTLAKIANSSLCIFMHTRAWTGSLNWLLDRKLLGRFTSSILQKYTRGRFAGLCQSTDWHKARDLCSCTP